MGKTLKRRRSTRVKVRRTHANISNSSDSTVSNSKKRTKIVTTTKQVTRVRMSGDKEKITVKYSEEVELPVCCICTHVIGGRSMYIGQGKYRCYDCEPGTPDWLKSEVGKNSNLRVYFLTELQRKKEGLVLEGVERAKRMMKISPTWSGIKRVRLSDSPTISRVRLSTPLERSRLLRRHIDIPKPIQREESVSRTLIKRKRLVKE